MLASRHFGIANAVGNEHRHIVSVNRINTVRSVSNDGVPASLQHRVESPVCQIAEIGGRPDDCEPDSCQAARSVNRVYSALFGVAELGQYPGVTPFEGCHKDDVLSARADRFKPEANVCISIDSPKIVGRVDMHIPRCHAGDRNLSM